MPVFTVSPEYEPLVNTLQWTVGNVPEGMQLVAAIGLLADRFGLSPTQAIDLQNGFGESYEAMNNDPQCEGLTSALDEIFATDPERQGHYFVYVPTEPSVAAPTILFLHGYGGNLKYYIWALKVAFPDSVIVAPTWGIGWHDGDVVYVDEVCRNVETHFGISLGNKWVMGLSAGGPAGFRVMNRKPSDYQGYICIASGLSQQRAAELSFTEPILMLNGINDVRFPIQFVRRGVAEMESHGLCVEQVELDRDHFFLLTQRVETFQIIESFIQKHSAVSVTSPNIDKPHWMLGLLRPWGLFFFGLSILCLVAFKKLRGGRKRLL
tara:strand:- start:10212 stop:11177 length:966 start_codon:yes stop_codon:yes gene_type:complete